MSVIRKIVTYRSNHPLAYRVLFSVLLFSSAITLVATAYQLYTNYRKDVDVIENQISQIRAGYENGISSGVWDYDHNQILKLIKGIKKLPNIQFLAIKDLDNKTLIALGNSSLEDVISHTFPLNFVDSNRQSHYVGSLLITASLEGAYTRLKESVFHILISQTIKTFLVSVFILLVIRQLITRHLAVIVSYLDKRQFDIISPPLKLPRRQGNKSDELDRVVKALNRMGNNLEKHLEERKTRESELIKNRNYVTQVINMMPSIIIGIDVQGCITQWNHEAVASSGLGVQEAMGRQFSEVLPQISPELSQVVASMTEEQTKKKFRVKIGTGKKTHFSDITLYPLSEDTHEGAVIRIDDVTEKTKMEEMMILNEKMISVGLLSASVAHEINNPINSVINLAEIQKEDSPSGSSAQDIAFRILKEGHRIADIVRSLLSFSHTSGEQKTLVDSKTVVEETLILVRTQLKKDGIHIETDIPNDLPKLFCHKSQIQQIILNIITNAQYALNKKFPTENENKMLSLSGETILKAKVPSVRFTFYDTGVGIKKEIIDEVLDPFFSTKPVGAGTGLGLSICKDMVANHNGQIDIESVECVFTKVIITIPTNDNND